MDANQYYVELFSNYKTLNARLVKGLEMLITPKPVQFMILQL
jgi:hypothetical protein